MTRNNVYDNYRYTPPQNPSQLGVRPQAALSSAFLSQAFLWMFLGLALSALTGYLAMANAGIQSAVIDLWLPIVIGQLILGTAIQMAIRSINATVALALFLVYAASMGFTLGVIVLAYAMTAGTSTVAVAFLSSAAMFGGAGLYGVVTKRSLATLNGYLAMATWGLLIGFVVNIFVGGSTLGFILSAVGVIVFTILTATETNRIAAGDYAAYTGSMEKASVFGALRLYIAFVGLFLMMLRLMSGARQR